MNKKGFVLVLVVIFSLIVMAAILRVSYMYGGKRRHARLYEERIKAYYLCEVGASQGIYYLNRGEPVSSDFAKPDKVQFAIGDQTYQINYVAEESGGDKVVHSWVKFPFSGMTYRLTVGGVKRQYPVFVKGYLPPLLD